jgi:hypothetical protein
LRSGPIGESRPAVSDPTPDLAYIGILREVDQAYEINADTPILVAAIITVVNRPSRGGWLVHHVGGYVAPEDVPRD